VRTTLGPIFLAGLFVVAGLGILHALRPFAHRPLRGAIATIVGAVGLAYMIGVAAVILIAIALLVLGVTLSLASFTVLALAVAVVGLAIGMLRLRRTPGELAAPARIAVPARVDLIAIGVAVLLFGGYMLAVLTQYTSAPMAEWDSWTIWTRKGVALFTIGNLDPNFWASPAYTFMHQDYPLLLPMLENLHFNAIGRVDTQSVHVQFWFLMFAFPWALGYLAARSGRALIWAPVAMGAALTPAFITVMIGGLADVPSAVFVCAGVLALGLWVDTRDRFNLAVATILLAGAASTKNEGLLAAAVALVIAGVVSIPERPRRALKDWAVAVVVFGLAIAPWQLWAASQGVPKDVNAGDGLNPIYLFEHFDRFMPSVRALEAQIVDQTRWSYVVPIAIVIAAVAIFVRRATRAGAFYLLCGLAVFFSLVWAYWASPHPLDAYLAQSAFRVVDGLVAVSMAALVHLAPRLASMAPFAGVEADPPDGETAALEPGAETEAGRRTPVPAGLLAFWRA
jgi:hypothetical protein